MMATQADSLLGRIANAAKNPPPLLRIRVSPKWARFLIAAGARPVAVGRTLVEEEAAQAQSTQRAPDAAVTDPRSKEETATPSSLRIEIGAEADAEAEELAELAMSLRRELLNLDVEAVEWVTAGPAPAGARGTAGVDPGTLVVTWSSSAVLGALAGTLASWAARDAARKITIRYGKDKISVSGALSDDQVRRITARLERYAQQ
jgi:hypothetical protein